MYSVLFSVLPAIQSFLAQLLGKVVALTIIIGDLSQLEHPVNKIIEKHVLYYRGVSGPVVRALDSGSDGPGSSPGWGTTLWP